MKELINATVHTEDEIIIVDHFSVEDGAVDLMDDDRMIRRIIPLSRVIKIDLNYKEAGRLEEPKIGILEKDEALGTWSYPGEHYDRDYCP